MTRRIYTYSRRKRAGADGTSSRRCGAFALGIGVLAFVINVLWSRGARTSRPGPTRGRRGRWSGSRPRRRRRYGFASTRRSVQGASRCGRSRADGTPWSTGLKTEKRELLCTTIVNAMPEHRYDDRGNVDLAAAARVGGRLRRRKRRHIPSGPLANCLAVPDDGLPTLLVLGFGPSTAEAARKVPNAIEISAEIVARELPAHGQPPPDSTCPALPSGLVRHPKSPLWWGNLLMIVHRDDDDRAAADELLLLHGETSTTGRPPETRLLRRRSSFR